MADLFKKAIQNSPTGTSGVAKTHNGADTYSTTTNALTDLFFVIGASRGKDITSMFEKALQEDTEKALRMLFWVRDIRGGQGERSTFRNLMSYLESNHPLTAIKLVHLVPEYGRWDDLLIFTSKKVQEAAFTVIQKGLNEKNGLCAKWMPRKGKTARELREFLGLSPKDYRKTLVSLSKTVETQMCAGNWNEIDFNKVPSLASARYQKAFNKHAPDNYQEWKEALSSSDPVVRATAKVNASAVYPHDVLKSVYTGDVDVARAQWDELPNFLGDSKILPMCDMSESMSSWGYYGNGGNSRQQGNVMPMDISISLGIYIADKQEGAFKDIICSFSRDAKLEVLKGDVVAKAKTIKSTHWGYSTNVERAFHHILKFAVSHKVPQDDMPEILLLISDMEFDEATDRAHNETTAYDMARQAYAKYGYDLPRVVFWNVNGREGNNPVTFKQNGTALVSGFSPSLLKSILTGDFEGFTPKAIMENAIMSTRYDPISKALLGER